jgi:hypothetical protein
MFPLSIENQLRITQDSDRSLSILRRQRCAGFSLVPFWKWRVMPFHFLLFNEAQYSLCVEMVIPAFISSGSIQTEVITLGRISLKQL